MTELETQARDFATIAHAGQKRKYTGEPYIEHPKAVVEILREVTDDEDVLAAGWLHDVVEDCAVTIGTLEKRFGVAVAALVEMVSDVSKPEDGNRAARKAIDCKHMASASPAAKTINLADLIHNTESILAHDPKFAAVYLREKAALLAVLREGDARLWARAAAQIGGTTI